MRTSASLPGSSEPVRSAQPERVGAVDGGGGNGLGGGQTQPHGGQCHHGLHVQRRGVPRVEIGGQGYRRSGIDESASRRAGAAAVERRAGQQGGHGAGSHQQRRLGGGGVLQMVDADGEMFHRGGNGGARSGLAGVHLAGKAEAPRGPQETDKTLMPPGSPLPCQIHEPRQAAPVAAWAGDRERPASATESIPSSPEAGRRSRKVGMTSSGSRLRAASTRRSLVSALSSGPHPVLTSTVVVPCRAMDWRYPRVRISRRRPLVARIRRAACSKPWSAPGGGNARWVWLSTNPGMTTRPAAFMSSAPRASARFSIRRVVPTSSKTPSRIRGAVRNQADFVQRRTVAGSSGATQGEQLARAPDQNGSRFCSPPLL